ncbi:hypothetical protein NUSPORA_00227 [Nucleospora cyclopteri]
MTEQFEEGLNIKMCLEKVLSISYNHVQAALGAKEVVKTLIREQQMEFVIITKDLSKKYQDIILHYCKEKNVPIIYLETREELGSIFPCKVKKAGAAGVKDFIRESEEKNFILNTLK